LFDETSSFFKFVKFAISTGKFFILLSDKFNSSNFERFSISLGINSL
jgi:hypothetical protein